RQERPPLRAGHATRLEFGLGQRRQPVPGDRQPAGRRRQPLEDRLRRLRRDLLVDHAPDQDRERVVRDRRPGARADPGDELLHHRALAAEVPLGLAVEFEPHGCDSGHAAIIPTPGPLPSRAGPPGRQPTGLTSFSMCSITLAATSTPVAFEMPSSPGDEFTSITIGPAADSIRSTPATRSPSARAAARAVLRYSAGSLNELALPPRCRFDRNSPGTACRRIAATTSRPTT